MGMKESVEFLKKIGDEQLRPCVTFITTNWDALVGKEETVYQNRELGMMTEGWRMFSAGKAGGARSFHFAVNCDDDDARYESERKGEIAGWGYEDLPDREP
jgi:hypothetical protein